MKKISVSVLSLLQQVIRDKMLFMIIFTPLLLAIFFKFGIPYSEGLLTDYFKESFFLAPYYLLFDLLMMIITPFFYCFISAMILLDEADESISHYLCVTPLGKRGYLLSRIGFPTLFSSILSCLLMPFFSLTSLSFMTILLVCILSGLSIVVNILLIITFSSNKVEGMAIAKLSGLLMLGVIIPFFIPSPIQYLAAVTPTFWIARFAISGQFRYIFGALAVIGIWIHFLYKKFLKKMV